VRLKGLPALERAVGRSVRAPLARTAELAREDDDELARQTDAAWSQVVRVSPGDVTLAASALQALPRAIAGRVIARAIFRCGRSARRSDVEAVLDLASGRPGRTVALIEGLLARRDRGYVRLVRASPENPPAAGDEEGGV
jgi:hypothetical protein